MTNYKILSGSRANFILPITEEDLQKNKKGTLDYFRNKLAIKGFRKGHVPDDVLIQNIHPHNLLVENASRALDKKYRIFMNENKLYPISSPKLENFNPEKLPCDVTVEVEIHPKVTLGNYQKIKIPAVKIEVSDKDLDEVIETLMAQKQKGQTVSREAQKKDMIKIDFIGKDSKGHIMPKTEGHQILVRLGIGHFIESFENVLLGMKAGEEKKAAPVQFPTDYGVEDLAGKKIFFDIKCQEVLEISAKDLDEDTIQELSEKETSLENFREDLREVIKQNKELSEKKKNIENYQNQIAKIVTTEFPESWIQKEVKSRMAKTKQDSGYKENPEAFYEKIGKSEKDMEVFFREQTEHDLKVLLGLSEIVDQENISLDKDELEKASQLALQKKSHSKDRDTLEAALQKIILNLKIDKYIQTITLDEDVK